MIFSDQRFSQSYADLRWKYFSSLLGIASPFFFFDPAVLSGDRCVSLT